MSEPKEFTEEEVKIKFVSLCGNIVEFWKNTEGKTEEEKIRGAVFSVLSMIDGSHIHIPGFILAPHPHESDKEFRKGIGEDYYPENHESNVKCDISGGLHELFVRTWSTE